MIHHASPLVIYLISGLYIIFVMQIVFQAGSRRVLFSKQGRSILYLAGVFLFCSLAGYISDLFPDSMLPIREAIHWVLVVITGLLVLTNQAGVVAKMLKHE